MLADELVELKSVDTISYETVCTVSKNELQPWRELMWCIPPGYGVEFVYAMKTVLDVDHRPYDSGNPVVGMDETNKQLIEGTRLPLPPQPGQPERYDYEHERHGIANLFIFVVPLGGCRRVVVTDRRTRVDWAWQVRVLLEMNYPNVQRVRLVLANLTTHTYAFLYEAR